MDPIDYDSPAALSKLLDNLGFSMKKRFGQNFMTSPAARKQIAAAAGDISGKTVWEIGPGFGALSVELLGKAALLRVFEIDHGFARVLRDLFGSRTDFDLVEGDALKNWKSRWASDSPAAVLGNLPYSVGSALIGQMLETRSIAPRMVFTVQKEVGERMVAAPDSDDYSSFSILCQAYCEVRIDGLLPPAAFYPRPEVTSAIVVLSPRHDTLDVTDPQLFTTLVRSAFASRRKTLENNVKASPLVKDFGVARLLDAARNAGIDTKARGETLSAEQYASWAAAILRV